MSEFTHLHTHSHYSLLSALPKVPDLVAAAKSHGMNALALTDNGNLYGAIEFYKECKAAGIKPIIGVDFYLAPRSRNDKETGLDSRYFRLVLLAKDFSGYKNLIKLVTASNLEGFFGKPRVDKEILSLYAKGLVAIVPVFGSETSEALRASNFEKARLALSFCQKNWGSDCYLEITRHPKIENHEGLVTNIARLSKESGVALVASADTFYIKPEDKRAWQMLMAIQGNAEYDRVVPDDTGDFSFLSAAEAEEFFAKYPEALANNSKVAERCNLELELGAWTFPKLTIKNGKTPDEELRSIVYEGLLRRGLKETKEIKERLEHELNIIKMKGFAPYFLVVTDLLRYAHEHGILTNIRGSVAGSLVTYLSDVTNINPLEYQIPFERFLNPERPGAPDVDMDFADNRRDEMIKYTRSVYGRDRVAQVGTFGTMMARGAVRDVARALGYPYGVGDRIAKLIPFGSQGFPMTIEHSIEITPELKEIYQKESDVREIIDMAKKIEGNARHISIHAAGVVISPVPLDEIVPTQYDPKESGKIITQYDMYSVEEAGLLKFDFLGLKNLTIIANTIAIIKKFRQVEIDIEKIPLDDPKTFSLLSRGETADTFQLNGSGMTRFLVDLKPTAIHDINAMVALYRPGPMQFIPEYIARKHDRSRIKYLDPALLPILEKTYGILVYQDDLLMIAHELAGYSWGEVDKFRKAVGKKIPEEMAAQRERFIKGCVEHSGWSQKKATELWTWIEPFAAYGFNKAHSISYGRVAYQTAYLKANFPGEYMTAVLTAESGDVEKVSESVSECKRMGIPVLPPDINESFREFTLIRNDAGDSIRFGLGSIKNFGEGISESIIEERLKNGKFASLSDFLSRIKNRNLNKKSLEALIYSGALDRFGERGAMIQNLDDLLEFNREHAREDDSQTSLFGALKGGGGAGLMLKPAPEMDRDEKLKREKELLGLYVSGHPLDKHRDKLKGRTMTIERIKGGLREGMIAVVSGIIEEAKPLLTKGGDRMMFLKMADFTGNIEVVIFPRTYQGSKNLLLANNCVAIKGRVSKRNGGISVIAEAVKAL